MAPSAVAMAKNNPRASGKTAPRAVPQAEPRCVVCEGDHSPGLLCLGSARPPQLAWLSCLELRAVMLLCPCPCSVPALPQSLLCPCPCPVTAQPLSLLCPWGWDCWGRAGRDPPGTKGSGPGAWSHLLYPEASTGLEVGSWFGPGFWTCSWRLCKPGNKDWNLPFLILERKQNHTSSKYWKIFSLRSLILQTPWVWQKNGISLEQIRNQGRPSHLV